MPWRAFGTQLLADLGRGHQDQNPDGGTSPARPPLRLQSFNRNKRRSPSTSRPAGVDLVRRLVASPTCSSTRSGREWSNGWARRDDRGPPPGADLTRRWPASVQRGQQHPSCRRRHRPGGVRFGRPPGWGAGQRELHRRDDRVRPGVRHLAAIIRRDGPGAVDEVEVNLLDAAVYSSRTARRVQRDRHDARAGRLLRDCDRRRLSTLRRPLVLAAYWIGLGGALRALRPRTSRRTSASRPRPLDSAR